MRSSFGYHENKPKLLLHDSPQFIRKELIKKVINFGSNKTSGPINAIFFDSINKTFQGGSSDNYRCMVNNILINQSLYLEKLIHLKIDCRIHILTWIS